MEATPVKWLMPWTTPSRLETPTTCIRLPRVQRPLLAPPTRVPSSPCRTGSLSGCSPAIPLRVRTFTFALLPRSFSMLNDRILLVYGHRYLENAISPAIAKRIMLDSSYSQIMVCGSNLGELFGAMFVLLATTLVQTPLPFLRFDALALLIVWALPAYSHQIRPHDASYAWRIAGMFIPVSMGWAAGDVSLAAFIQASLARMESADSQVSALGSVMAFLYSSYIITYAILGSLLGTYIDKVFARDGNIYRALLNIGGVQFTVLSAIIIFATLTPKGALAFNPSMINDAELNGPADLEHQREAEDDVAGRDDSSVEKEKEKPVKTTDIGAMIG
ncbi:hypothetical protein FS842_004445 [Serendipita sp. 407]|nr:hypothetical protein FS842_004445 [Serendipita sp. 407]